jgi:hypothetical protein
MTHNNTSRAIGRGLNFHRAWPGRNAAPRAVRTSGTWTLAESGGVAKALPCRPVVDTCLGVYCSKPHILYTVGQCVYSYP